MLASATLAQRLHCTNFQRRAAEFLQPQWNTILSPVPTVCPALQGTAMPSSCASAWCEHQRFQVLLDGWSTHSCLSVGHAQGSKGWLGDPQHIELTKDPKVASWALRVGELNLFLNTSLHQTRFLTVELKPLLKTQVYNSFQARRSQSRLREEKVRVREMEEVSLFQQRLGKI